MERGAWKGNKRGCNLVQKVLNGDDGLFQSDVWTGLAKTVLL